MEVEKKSSNLPLQPHHIFEHTNSRSSIRLTLALMFRSFTSTPRKPPIIGLSPINPISSRNHYPKHCPNTTLLPAGSETDSPSTATMKESHLSKRESETSSSLTFLRTRKTRTWRCQSPKMWRGMRIRMSV